MIDPILTRTVTKNTPHDGESTIEVIQCDNSPKKVIVPNSECELLLFLKCNLGIKKWQRSKSDRLIELIDNYAANFYSDSFLGKVMYYNSLGYEVTITKWMGKDAVKMVKRYSYKRCGEITCMQVTSSEVFSDNKRIDHLLNYMYENIEEQEKTGKYYEE